MLSMLACNIYVCIYSKHFFVFLCFNLSVAKYCLINRLVTTIPQVSFCLGFMCVCVCVCVCVLVYATLWGPNVTTRIVKPERFHIVGTCLQAFSPREKNKNKCKNS